MLRFLDSKLRQALIYWLHLDQQRPQRLLVLIVTLNELSKCCIRFWAPSLKIIDTKMISFESKYKRLNK